MIAVVMGAPDYKARFQDAQTLLSYGFSICRIYVDENKEPLAPLTVKGGVTEEVCLEYQGEFRYLDTTGSDLSTVEKVLDLPEAVQAPVEKGAEAGRIRYLLNGAEIGSVPIFYTDNVEKAGYLDYLQKIFDFFLL